jgi:hypothetical protein
VELEDLLATESPSDTADVLLREALTHASLVTSGALQDRQHDPLMAMSLRVWAENTALNSLHLQSEAVHEEFLRLKFRSSLASLWSRTKDHITSEEGLHAVQCCFAWLDLLMKLQNNGKRLRTLVDAYDIAGSAFLNALVSRQTEGDLAELCSRNESLCLHLLTTSATHSPAAFELVQAVMFLHSAGAVADQDLALHLEQTVAQWKYVPRWMKQALVNQRTNNPAKIGSRSNGHRASTASLYQATT